MTVIFLLLSAALVSAQTPVAVRIQDTTAPSGDVATLQLTLNKPARIISGIAEIAMNTRYFGDFLGISFNNASGTATGTASYNSGRLTINLADPSGQLGLVDPNQPFLTIAMAVKRTAPPRSKIPVSIARGKLILNDPAGKPYAVSTTPGTVTITPAHPETAAKMPPAVSPEPSADATPPTTPPPPPPPPAKTGLPSTFMDASVPYWTEVGKISAVSIQNPNSADASVSIEAYDVFNTKQSETTLKIQSGEKVTHVVKELLTLSSPNGGYLRVRSDSGVQVVGLVTDSASGKTYTVPAIVHSFSQQ